MEDKKKKLYKNVNGVLYKLSEDEIQKYDELIKKCYKINFEKLKEAELTRLAEETKKEFYEEYPLHRQCNIAIFVTEEEKAEFKKFHNIKSKEYDKTIEQINNCCNENELFSI